MIRDGKYAAWYRTSRGEGTGVVYLANGEISGGDSVISYGGSYQVEGERFTATLTTRRHTAGQPTLFGVDEVEVRLTGISHGPIAWCSGTAAQAPDLVFEATLILSRDEETPSGDRRPAARLVSDKWPKELVSWPRAYDFRPLAPLKKPGSH
jgi:hypothetical protein